MVSKTCLVPIIASAIVFLPSIVGAGTLEKYQLPPQISPQSQFSPPSVSAPGVFQDFEAEIVRLNNDEKIQLINLFAQKRAEAKARNNFQEAEYYSTLMNILTSNL